jgi:hypothetical protein
MRTLVLCGFAFLFGATLTLSTRAAMVEVQAAAYDIECGTSCGNFQNLLGPGTAQASYSNPAGGSASAFATVIPDSPVGLSLRAFATGSAGEFASNRGSASASWQDVIHTTGTLLDLLIDVQFELTGSKSGDAHISASVGYCVGSNCPPPIVTDVSTSFHVTAPELISPSKLVTLTINLDVAASGIAITGPASSTADFGHSLTLVSITALDANGNFVPGASLVSESGFNYNAFLVPEPATLTICGIALAALGRRHRSDRLPS